LNARPLTRNQALVLEALTAAAMPLSAYTILDRLRDQGLRAPLQIYRALDRLIAAGLIHRLDSVNAFVACAHGEAHRHEAAAFAICEACGRVSEFTDAKIAARLEAWAGAAGFVPRLTTIELRGRCEACAGA
jgi:Fur family transcriptional regulator, zinc uptake regulator